MILLVIAIIMRRHYGRSRHSQRSGNDGTADPFNCFNSVPCSVGDHISVATVLIKKVNILWPTTCTTSLKETGMRKCPSIGKQVTHSSCGPDIRQGKGKETTLFEKTKLTLFSSSFPPFLQGLGA
jgi:hypothetical protein